MLRCRTGAAISRSTTCCWSPCPNLDWREEKAVWFTTLVNSGVAIKLNGPPLAELPGWIAGRLRRQQQSAELDSLKFIAERVEGNLLAAHQEIQKLGLLYPAGVLSLAQVREAVLNVARYDLDGLRDALLAGDLARLTRTLDGLMHEGEPPPLVLWAMSEEIRTLTTVRAGLDRGKPIDQLLKEAKVWGPRLNPVKKPCRGCRPQHSKRHWNTLERSTGSSRAPARVTSGKSSCASA